MATHWIKRIKPSTSLALSPLRQRTKSCGTLNFWSVTELKNILIKYYPGAGTNMLNSVLFDIFATEEDLASHTRVEDYLFVPAILALEKQL